MSFALLVGCSSSSDATFQTARDAIFRDRGVDRTPLNPEFRYLRVIGADGRVALLVLGYVERGPGDPVEVWYSGERETLRLQNGRVIGASGLPTEWLNVALPAFPSWTALARMEQPFRWRRVRDVMPGHRINVQDALTLRPIKPPWRTQLRGAVSSLTWFEERDESLEHAPLALLGGRFVPRNALPPARYAISTEGGRETVVYGEQCLTWEFCFTWQRWPAAPASVDAGR